MNFRPLIDHLNPAEASLWRALRRVYVGGAIMAVFAFVIAGSLRSPVPDVEMPLPHQVPSSPNAASLRFAMVHDVIHERFAKHGRHYYEARNQQAEKLMAYERTRDRKLTDAYFALQDDLAIGLHALGRTDEAVKLMQAKLDQQKSQQAAPAALYPTYANLGTLLLFANLKPALDGDAEAAEQIRDGLDYIRQAIQINPDAHFGREIWQAAFMEFFLAALEQPELLTRYDFIGNDLTDDLNHRQPSALIYPSRIFYRFYGGGDFGKTVKQTMADPSAERTPLRRFIRPVGAEGKWREDVPSGHKGPEPFDQPVLGVIGMWREGGGANPHFCMFLGETMLRVGQRRLAWCAYERGVLLADSFWPDKEIRDHFIAHCRNRQQLITKTLPDEHEDSWRSRFNAELQVGLNYQAAYQTFEKQRLESAADLDDPRFDEPFHREHGSIATPIGNADFALVESDQNNFNWQFAGVPLLVGAMAAYLLAVSLRKPRSPAASLTY